MLKNLNGSMPSLQCKPIIMASSYTLAAGQSASQTCPGSSGDSHFYPQSRIEPVPQPRIFTLKTAQARSGAPHFHAQNGSSSIRSPAHAQNGSSSFQSPHVSLSKRLKLDPEPRIFTLDRELVPEPGPIFHFAAVHRPTYQNLG